MSRKEFAFKLGVVGNYVTKVEFGHRRLPLERARLWALLLGLPAATFVTAVHQDADDEALAKLGDGVRLHVRCEEA